MNTIDRLNVTMNFRSTILSLMTALIVTTTVHSSPNDLPDMGSSIDQYLSLNKEQELGDSLIRQLQGQAPLLQDPLINGYIKTIGFKIVAQNNEALNRQFDFFVLSAPSINAFAMPGGYIFMHSGLLLKASTEDEMAGVLAHEIAHVTQRHIARRFEKASQLSFPSLLGMLAALVVSQGNAQAGIAGVTAINASAQQLIINHTRSNESEADRVGIETLTDAGFDPDGMTGFFEKLLQQYRHVPKPPEFLLTHPLSERRLAEARTRALGLPRPNYRDQSIFWIIQERVRAIEITNPLMISEDQYMRRLELVHGAKKDAILHGYALWLSKTKNSKKAVDIAKKLVEKHPKSIEHRVLLGEVYIADGQYKKAIQTIQQFLSYTPLNYPLTMTLAEAQRLSKNYQAALNLLLPMAWQHPNEPLLFKTLAEVQSLNGMTDESKESQGQYLYAIGDLAGALFQFQQALNGKSTDPYFNTRVRARISDIQEQLAELRGGRSKSRTRRKH
jgi:predicted Zn-dependent protease